MLPRLLRSGRAARSIAATVAMAMLCALFSLTACSDLQPIEPNRCGNRIVDDGEACDEGTATELCTAECRLSCTATAAASPPGYLDNPEDAVKDGFCPAGQACGVNGLCAAPSGRFRAETSFELDVAQAEVGDVDGDGVADLVSTSATELRILFGDSDGAPLTSTSLQPSPSATGPFLLADFDRSGGVDMAIPTDGGVVPFFADSGTLQHRPSPTVQLPREGFIATVDGVVAEVGGGRRSVVVYVEAQGDHVVLRDLVAAGNRELARCDTGGPAAIRRGPLAVTPVLAGSGVATGELLAVAVERAAAPGVCIFAPANPTAPADPGWTPRYYDLAAGARFEPDGNVPLLWANTDGDACPELLAPIHSGAAVAGYNVFDSAAGCGFATAATLVPSWSAATRALGAGNLDRLGADELVTSAAVFRIDSQSAVTRIGPPVDMDRLRVADFNGDGLVDIAGADTVAPGEPSREAIRVLRTGGPAGAWQATTVVVETLRPVAQLIVGDYDGDRIADLALTEVIAVNAQRVPTAMAVSVIYGQRSEIPSYRVIREETSPVVIATLGPRAGSALEADAADDLGLALASTATTLAASVLFGSAQRSLTAPLAHSTGTGAAAVAAGPWANPDELLDLVVYTDSTQYLWPQVESGFTTTAIGSPSPLAARGLRDFAIATAATTMGATTVVSVTPSQQQAAVGGVGACPSAWTGSGLPAAGPRPTIVARDLDGLPGDELLITSQPGNGVQSVYAYSAIGPDCKLGATFIPGGHPLLGCDAATGIEASFSPDEAAVAPGRRELLAICRPPGLGSQLIRFDYTGDAYAVTDVGVQLPGRARRLMTGDFTGDGLEDAISITTVGSVDFATLLVQCAQTDSSCDP